MGLGRYLFFVCLYWCVYVVCLLDLTDVLCITAYGRTICGYNFDCGFYFDCFGLVGVFVVC